MQIELTDDQLTENASLVIDGTVSTSEIVTLCDDPFLPAGWEDDGETQRMVDAGFALAKWRIHVHAVVKGRSVPEMWAVRGVGGAGVWIEGQDDGRALFNAVIAGRQYRMWLEEDAWFGHNHWILLRARPI